jgi:hypothetical protein
MISLNMVTIKAYYTNKRMQNINTHLIINENYRKEFISMKQKAVVVTEIFYIYRTSYFARIK